jgi:hypothetical protein
MSRPSRNSALGARLRADAHDARRLLSRQSIDNVIAGLHRAPKIEGSKVRLRRAAAAAAAVSMIVVGAYIALDTPSRPTAPDPTPPVAVVQPVNAPELLSTAQKWREAIEVAMRDEGDRLWLDMNTVCRTVLRGVPLRLRLR